MKESMTIEVKPFLNGGHVLLKKNKGRKEKADWRFLKRYEYEYFLKDLENLVKVHL